MTLYYEIYNNIDYENSIMYSFGFNGYVDNLNGLYKNIKSKKGKVMRVNNVVNSSLL